MRAVLQRVSDASVVVDEEKVARIGRGLLIFVAIKKGDTIEDGKRIIKKVLNLRVFSDEDGLLNLSAADLKVSLMVVSQFTINNHHSIAGCFFLTYSSETYAKHRK